MLSIPTEFTLSTQNMKTRIKFRKFRLSNWTYPELNLRSPHLVPTALTVRPLRPLKQLQFSDTWNCRYIKVTYGIYLLSMPALHLFLPHNNTVVFCLGPKGREIRESAITATRNSKSMCHSRTTSDAYVSLLDIEL